MKRKKLHIAFDPVYAHPLPEDHRFPMVKYELIPGKLLHEGIVSDDNFFVPQPATDESILLTHDADYLDKLKKGTLTRSEERRMGFPQSAALTQRERVITGGTIECCAHAMVHGVAMNVAGGTHHAFRDHGEGFCLLNDFAIAANLLLAENAMHRVLIVDLDVHQGNGTAKIFEHEARVFTLSMHGRNNYPFRKEKSDLDIELADGTTGDAYLDLLSDHLPQVLEHFKPQFVFYLSGVDVLSSDRFGKLDLSLDACMRRDEFVFSELKKRDIKTVVAMGGGYSPDVNTIVEAHCNTFRMARDVFDLA